MSIKEIWRQFVRLIPILSIVYLPGIALIIGLYIVYRTTGISFGNHFIDHGLVSNIGILFLASTAAVCLFSFFFIINQGRTNGSTRFLLFFGLFSALLTLDDFFMIHEAIGDAMAANASVSDDVGEFITFAVYILIFAFYAFKYRKTILLTEYIFLYGALVLFTINLALDMLHSRLPDIFLFKGEEIFKFFAIITWSTYAVRTAYKMVKSPEPSAEKRIS